VVGVVDEEHEVAETHEGVGAVPRLAESLDRTMDIADDMDPHGDHPIARYRRVTGDLD
jgi:hypothetical protein